MKALKAIFGVGLIVAVVVVLVQLVPPYYNNYQLQDVISDEARMNTYTPKPVEEMREHVFRKCKDLDIPVTRDQINVAREGQTVSISLDYTVHVDLPGYPVDLKFHSSTQNKAY
jgi:Domain of unknown function (DUF4845)